MSQINKYYQDIKKHLKETLDGAVQTHPDAQHLMDAAAWLTASFEARLVNERHLPMQHQLLQHDPTLLSALPVHAVWQASPLAAQYTAQYKKGEAIKFDDLCFQVAADQNIVQASCAISQSDSDCRISINTNLPLQHCALDEKIRFYVDLPESLQITVVAALLKKYSVTCSQTNQVCKVSLSFVPGWRTATAASPWCAFY